MVSKEFMITPESKVGEVLEAYPELEGVFVEMAPEFKKLKNPVLRKTVARITTLQHAARVAGLDAGLLVNRLREAVGQATLENALGTDPPSLVAPAWWRADLVQATLDVRPTLAAGQKPIGTVLSSLNKLRNNQILEVIAPFLPAPLLDIAGEKGFRAWSRQEPDGTSYVFFQRVPARESDDDAPLIPLE